MARLFMCGWEGKKYEASYTPGRYGFEKFYTTGVPTFVTSPARTSIAVRCSSAVYGNVEVPNGEAGSGPAEAWLSCWVYIDTLPSGDVNNLLSFGTAANNAQTYIIIDHTGLCELYVNKVGGGYRITTSTYVAPTGKWLLFKIHHKNSTTAANNIHEVILPNGTVLADTATTADVSSGTVNYITVGAGAATGQVLLYDDLCVNDDQGTTDKGYPDGTEKVLLLPCISDNNRGAWTGGGGGTTNLYDGVNNLPPTGAVTDTDATSIKTTGTAAADCDLNVQAYTTQGIVPSDIIRYIYPYVRHGEVAAVAIGGGVQLVSNPAIAEATFNFGNALGAHGAEIGNWRNFIGTISKDPQAIAVGTSPVIRVTKKATGASQTAVCDFLGLMVSYTPNVGGGFMVSD